MALTNTSTGGDGPLSCKWEFSDMWGINNATTTEENPTKTFWHSVISKGNYITGRNRHPFSGSGCATTADFTASSVTGIASLSVNFTNLSSGFYPPISYEWDFDNDGVVDPMGMNPSYLYNESGKYTVKLKVRASSQIQTRSWPTT